MVALRSPITSNSHWVILLWFGRVAFLNFADIKKLTFLCFLLLLLACGRFGDKKKKEDSDTRIVSLSKQYNEIIYALGAEKDLVAVDLSSSYPPPIKKLPNVGYHMALSLEGILSMEPTVILREVGPYSVGPESLRSCWTNCSSPFVSET